MKVFSLDTDGSLIVVESGIDSFGKPVSARTNIKPNQIARFRADPDFESALQAAAGTKGNLSAQDLASLPKP